MSGALRVVVVDDQAVIRAGLRMIIDHEADMVVVAEAADGLEAVVQVRRLQPDVVLMDVRMPRLDGIEATRQILDESGRAPGVLVLTTFEDDEYVFGSLRAGASGFLLKDASPDALIAAIRSVAQGDALVDPVVTRQLVHRWAELESEHVPPTTRAAAIPVQLTDREQEILIGLARGRSNRLLAEELFLSEATIKTHVSHLLAKLEVRSRVQAVILAYEHGIVAPGEPGNIGWV